MLARAYLYKEALNSLLLKASDDPYYDYLFGTYAEFNKTIDDNDYYKHQWVNLDTNYNIVGFMEAEIDRPCHYISSLTMINFKKEWNSTFYLDLKELFLRFFLRYNYEKICFKVIIGNRNEKIYDKFISRYGGRIVGTFYRHNALRDGSIKDVKYYELQKEEFMKVAMVIHSKQIADFSLRGVK